MSAFGPGGDAFAPNNPVNHHKGLFGSCAGASGKLKSVSSTARGDAVSASTAPGGIAITMPALAAATPKAPVAR
ncbi:hypothetical protein EB75_03175 [Mycobacterium sp. ST-F2]|nr:hypothetical protein EB75_03175 [Mycobacterium sp. ST-F2]